MIGSVTSAAHARAPARVGHLSGARPRKRPTQTARSRGARRPSLRPLLPDNCRAWRENVLAGLAAAEVP
eukprot:2430520-Lingulodinium_polyedra.AAC.1